MCVSSALEKILLSQPTYMIPVIFQHLTLCETSAEKLVTLEMLKSKLKLLLPHYNKANKNIEFLLAQRIIKVLIIIYIIILYNLYYYII
jgi:hypothetical protein